MRGLISLLAVTAFLTLGPVAEARVPGKHSRGHAHTGTIVSVEAHGLVVSFEGKKGKSHKHHVEVGTSTRITLNGKPATLSELRAGDRVTITGGHKRPARRIAATR